MRIVCAGAVAMLVWAGSFARAVVTESDVKEGDIIFHKSASRQAQAIALATGSSFTHVGLILFENGRPFVLEAVQPVKRTPLHDWIGGGRGSHAIVKRLRDADTLLTGEALKRLRQVAAGFLGKAYDWEFGWSDDRIYCSELVWKAFERALSIQLAPLRKLRDFDLSHPAVQAIMKERYGSEPPLEMDVIAPSDLLDSKALVTVVED